MAFRNLIIELKGKGKNFIENTRYTIRQYRLTRGSGRTEQIFGMSLATKILISLLLLLVVAALFFGAKTVMQEQDVTAIEPERDAEAAEKVVENEITGALVEPSVPVEEHRVEQAVEQPSAPEPSPPPSPPSSSSLPDFIVDKGQIAETAPLAVIPESIDISNMGAACQVEIRDKEENLAAASQFFQEANQSYHAALDAVREPADRLREAMEELKTKKAALETKAQKCDARVETSEPVHYEPVSDGEPVPELVPIEPPFDEATENLETQTNEATS